VSRISPLDPPYDPATAAQLARMMPGAAEPIALFRMFVRNLPMARAMSEWGEHQLGRTLALSRREREIVIDRTCALAGCEYEWGVHVAVFAERVGLDAAQLRSLTVGGPDDPCWTEERERTLIRIVDAVWARGDLDDAEWAGLRGTFDEAQTLDLLLLCGWYRAISLVANTVRLPNEPGAPTFAGISRASE
jgi:alkylhydroperoxidase family enzyme